MSTSFTRGENPLRADKLNTAFGERVARSGDTMQGMLTLHGNPVGPFDAATKQYVDANIYYNTAAGSFLNVLDFGADPTGVADSSAAFNAAASQAMSNGHHKAVYAPTGTYLIRQQISLSAGQHLFGDGDSSTILLITDQFDPGASSVILCTGGFIDPGPTIRDLLFWFLQPNDVASRSTFKTIAAGGTAGLGGTGVQYPWAISTAGTAGRITVRNVVIQGAWNGINATGTVFWISTLKISAFNIGIDIGGTAAAGVLDWAHLTDIEFWTFGMPYSGQQNIYQDGNTIAMRVNNQNGLTAQNISCFTSRLVFTSDAGSGWFTFSNLAMDGPQSTIEVADAFFFQIVNLYTSGGGGTGARPACAFAGGAHVILTNWYAHTSGPNPLLVVTGGDVTLSNMYWLTYANTVSVATVSNGSLRISDGLIGPVGSVAWTVPLISQTGGALQLDALDLRGSSPSGVAVQYAQGGPGNSMGRLMLSAGWSTRLPNTTTQAIAGPMRLASSVATGTAQLVISGSDTQVNGQEAKIRFFGTFPSGDTTNYLAASIRAGWNSLAWSGSYLDVLLTNAGNGGAGDDVNMVQAARFDNANGLVLAGNLGVQGGIANIGTTTSNGAYCTLTGGVASERALQFIAGSLTRWKLVAANTVAEDFSLYRFDNSGNYAGTPFSVLRANGGIVMTTLAGSASYASDAAASAGGVIVGQLYRNGSAVQVRVT